MPVGWMLKRCAQFGVLFVFGLPTVAAAQPDIRQDQEQCSKAKTAKECQAALPACGRALESLEQAPNGPNLDTLMERILIDLADCESEAGTYSGAEVHYRRALAAQKRLYGPENVAVATSLQALADILLRLGKYGDAEILVRQALTMRQKLLGAQHPRVARSLEGLAVVLERLGKFEESERFNRQALEMRQKLFGAEHILVAGSLDSLAWVLHRLGQYETAERLARRALEMSQRLLGDRHRSVARSLSILAWVMTDQGKYETAEMLFRQALEIDQKSLDAQHPDIAGSLKNLAMVLAEQGKYKQAETLHRQALEVMQKVLGPQHPNVALILDNLAMAMASQGQYEEAERLYRQALEIDQKVLGPQHPNVAMGLISLASVLTGKGQYEEAERLYRQALEMNQILLGLQHPNVALSLSQLAWVLTRQGHYEEAERLYRQALEIDQKVLGSQYPHVAMVLRNLAILLMRRGIYQAAIPLLSQAAQIHESLLRSTFSETRMRSALNLMRSDEDVLYGLLLQQPTDFVLQRLALTTALLRKGRAAEAGAVVNHLLHTGLSDPSLQERFEQWLQIRQQREALIYGKRGHFSPDSHRARLTELSQQADDLESQLAMTLPALRKLQPPPFENILPAVAARLPSDGVLLEAVWVQPRNFKAMGKEAFWAAPRYLAIVLSADQKIAVHDLGDAATLDRLVQSMLAALRNPGSDPKPLAQMLYNQILRPLLPPSVRNVYLSMDGTLSLVPFDALHDGQDYLLGRKSFHYLTSGRDLLRNDTAPAKNPALLLADPDFGQGAQSPRTPETETFYKRLATLTRLPGAFREVGFIGKLLSIGPYVGAAATEAVIRLSRTPWLLHIASHGLFLGSEPWAGAGGRSASGMGSPWDQRKGVWIGDFATESVKMNGDPDALSRSALVLAGASRGDQAKSADEDGLLTGDEARSLDLQGTQLVVLSACDTGQGELSVGQGVYGLRRAFLVAGAETLVTSLWQVGDEATGKLMEMYYQKMLVEKKGRLEAMQEAMQQMRKTYKHPYYWAPFQVTGSDGPLRPPVQR